MSEKKNLFVTLTLDDRVACLLNCVVQARFKLCDLPVEGGEVEKEVLYVEMSHYHIT